MATNEELRRYESAQNEYAEKIKTTGEIIDKIQNQIIKDFEKGTITLKQALDKLSSITESNVKGVKNTIDTQKQLIKAMNAQKDALLKSIVGNAPSKPELNWWQKLGEKGGKDIDWNLDRRIKGFEQILSGSFKSGSLNILQSFAQGKALLNMPLIQFGVAAAKLGLALVDWKYSADRLANRLAGGSYLSPDAKNRKLSRAFDIDFMLTAFGQKKEDYDKYFMSELGVGTRKNIYGTKEEEKLAGTYGFARSAIADLGGDPNKINSLITQQISIGRTPDNINKFNYKLIKAIEGLDKLTTNKFLQAYEDLNKTLISNNINGTANAKSLAKFSDELNKGTLNINDFTRALTSRRQSSTSTLAGVGAMLAERGLGGKELQEAYSKGDMIAVAGIMRRGGMSISRDIEKLAPEIASQLGTSDIREALALQADTAWGGLSPDLKNLQVQNVLASGGTMTLGLEGATTKLKDVEQKEFNERVSEQIKVENDLRGSMETLVQVTKLGAEWIAKKYEQDQINVEKLSNIMLSITTTNPSQNGTKFNSYAIANPTVIL